MSVIEQAIGTSHPMFSSPFTLQPGKQLKAKDISYSPEPDIQYVLNKCLVN